MAKRRMPSGPLQSFCLGEKHQTPERQMFSAEEVLAAPFQDGWRNTGHRSVKCSVTISYADLDRSPGRASYVTLLQMQPPSFVHSSRSWERTCSSHPPLC